MRKQFLLLMALCLAVGQSWAERIDVATAREVARTVASRGSTLRSAGELSLVYAAAPGQTGSALRSASAAGEADYFVFNVPGDGGFVIVAGDDRVRPVLGYSHAGSFDPDNLPENLRGMLAYYQNQITWAEDNAVEASPAISAEWSQYQSGTALRAAGNGVLLETANWGQGEPYNRMTPENAVTGCVATAMGIIMRYHEYPDKAVNPPASNSYWYVGDPIETKIDYSEGYNWDNMPLSYSDYTDVQANEVSKLLYHCGANVEMIYNQDGGGESGTQTIRVAKALSEVFGYSPSVRYLQREAYRWDEWKAMIRAELDAGYPLIYDGQNPVGGGHAFVCDGYTPEGLFHINWGWDGGSNGYYQLSVLDNNGDGYGYSDDQAALLNIRPEQSGERYYIWPYLTQASYSVTPAGGVIANNISFKYYALYDHTFYYDLGIVNADGTIAQEPLNAMSLDFKAYLGGWRPYDGYSQATTLSVSSLSEGQYITLLCSADGENWEVMRATEDVPLGIGADGVINPSEDDPNEPEQPMYVSVNWNRFDDNFLGVTGLDNNQYAYDNVQGIAYGFSGNISDATIRYTITNYAEWKDQIAIYYGDYSIGASGAGTPVTIGSDGSFEISVAKSMLEDNAYVNYLKVLSDKPGELVYTIEVYSGESESPLLKEEGHSMAFIGDVTPNFSSNPLRGAVDEELPFSFRIVSGADALVGKPLTLDVSLQSTELTQEDVQLLGPDGQPVALGLSGGIVLYTQTPIALGALAMNTDYSLTLKCTKEIPEANNALLGITLLVDGKRLPLTFNDVRLIVDPAGASTYSVTANFTGLSLRSGSTTSVAEGGEVKLYLNVDDPERYQLPATITVTMGGVTLTQGEDYFYAGSTISIPNVTGDIVVTATAEPIPATTYTITAEQMENLTTNLPISVQEGKNVTITITANEGYLVPEALTVKSGNAELSKDYYTYIPSEDRKSATLTIERVPSDLRIYAIAVPEPKTFTITGTFTNVKGTSQNFSQPIELEEGLDFEFTLDAVEGYRVPAHITIVNTDTNTPLVEGVDYTYDRSSDIYAFITVFTVNSNLAITAVGEQIGYYGVALKLEGVVATPDVIENQFAENTEGGKL